MAFDKAKYDLDYLKQNVVLKNISFNRNKPDDMELLEWINQQSPSANGYVKNLIREDMERHKAEKPAE